MAPLPELNIDDFDHGDEIPPSKPNTLIAKDGNTLTDLSSEAETRVKYKEKKLTSSVSDESSSST